jgi:hypothetical protein
MGGRWDWEGGILGWPYWRAGFNVDGMEGTTDMVWHDGIA